MGGQAEELGWARLWGASSETGVVKGLQLKECCDQTCHSFLPFSETAPGLTFLKHLSCQIITTTYQVSFLPNVRLSFSSPHNCPTSILYVVLHHGHLLPNPRSEYQFRELLLSSTEIPRFLQHTSRTYFSVTLAPNKGCGSERLSGNVVAVGPSLHWFLELIFYQLPHVQISLKDNS